MSFNLEYIVCPIWTKPTWIYSISDSWYGIYENKCCAFSMQLYSNIMHYISCSQFLTSYLHVYKKKHCLNHHLKLLRTNSDAPVILCNTFLLFWLRQMIVSVFSNWSLSPVCVESQCLALAINQLASCCSETHEWILRLAALAWSWKMFWI